jgi:hypothetical protein
LLPGKYLLDLAVKTYHNEWVDSIKGIPFFVEALSVSKNTTYRHGLVDIDAEWSLPVHQAEYVEQS